MYGTIPGSGPSDVWLPAGRADNSSSWWTFRIFLIFFSVRGAGEKEEASKEAAGGSVLTKNGGRGGVSKKESWGGGRALGECLWGGGGG